MSLLRERGFDADAQEGDEEARGPIPSAADRADALTRAREICDAEQEQVLAGRADFASSAPSATSPAGSTTSCAAVPAVRATRA